MSKFKAIIFARKRGQVILSRTRNMKITTWLGTGFALVMGAGILNASFAIINHQDKKEFNKLIRATGVEIVRNIGLGTGIEVGEIRKIGEKIEKVKDDVKPVLVNELGAFRELIKKDIEELKSDNVDIAYQNWEDYSQQISGLRKFIKNNFALAEKKQTKYFANLTDDMADLYCDLFGSFYG